MSVGDVRIRVILFPVEPGKERYTPTRDDVLRRVGPWLLACLIGIIVAMFSLATLPAWGPTLARSFSTVVGAP